MKVQNFLLAADHISTWAGKATAWLEIVISTVGLGFFLPSIGLMFLFLNTIGSVPWCFLLARDFFKIESAISKTA